MKAFFLCNINCRQPGAEICQLPLCSKERQLYAFCRGAACVLQVIARSLGRNVVCCANRTVRGW